VDEKSWESKFLQEKEGVSCASYLARNYEERVLLVCIAYTTPQIEIMLGYERLLHDLFFFLSCDQISA